MLTCLVKLGVVPKATIRHAGGAAASRGVKWSCRGGTTQTTWRPLLRGGRRVGLPLLAAARPSSSSPSVGVEENEEFEKSGRSKGGAGHLAGNFANNALASGKLAEGARARAVSTPSTGTSLQSRGAYNAPLSAREMDRAARLAALNSYVYTVPPDELQAAVESAGMELLAQGQNRYTRWFVAEGHLPNVIARQSLETGEASIELEPDHPAHSRTAARQVGEELEFETDADMDWGVERLVFIRGVVWRDPLVDLRSLWQELSNCWPTPFEERCLGTKEVVVHRGISGIAGGVWQDLLPSLLDIPHGMRLTFAGHSLGGAIALILTAMARIKLRIPDKDLSCHTFGSPAVMAHSDKEGSDKVCEIVGLKPSTIQHFCLDDDPVPRILLAVDPAYSLFRRSSWGEQLLNFRESLLGGRSGPFTMNRFLFEPIGRLFLIRWNPTHGTRLVEIGEGAEAQRLEEAMQMRIEEMIGEPLRVVKAFTDHNQAAYVTEIMTTALELLKAEDREREDHMH